MPAPTITLTKTTLALVLGFIALVGIWISKNPDGDHFFGRFRDDIRVARVAEQIATLAEVTRKKAYTRLSCGPVSTDLTATLVTSNDIPGKMIDRSVTPPVLRSPWGTEITSLSEGLQFSITVPVSSYGCYKLLLSFNKSAVIAAYANGVEQNLPISSKADVKGCTRQSINIVTFLFD